MITGLEPTEDQSLRLSDPLVSWVLSQINPWEQYRDDTYKERWGEYYRIWRGIHAVKDKERIAERSKIITPATQQAVESQVAEMEESIFARKRWFDLENFDPTGDPDMDAEASEIILDFLHEDMELAHIQTVMTEAILNGALYGFGVIKVMLELDDIKTPQVNGQIEIKKDVKVTYEAVDPINLVADPASTSLDDGLGVAHIYMRPRHLVNEKQDMGVYETGDLGSPPHSMYLNERKENRPVDEKNCEILEWHGKVPRMLLKANTVENPLHSIDETEDDTEMVESIVVIANRNKRLRARENPFLMTDRAFVSFQFDTVPNRLHGRGVVEKAYNAQKALDTEVRARIDSLALSTYPVTLVNTLMAPRSGNSSITPGKKINVNGNPNEAFGVLKLPGPDQNSYRHTADLERMVQTATGSVSPSSPMGVNPTNETSSGMSMMLGAMFKRSKRTLRNIEDGMIKPLIKKTIWRYMQFKPERYPFADYRFLVNSGLGASAREFEVSQLMQFLQTMEQGSPEYWIIVRAALENFSLDSKDELLVLVKERVEAARNPQPPQPTIDQQMAMKKLEIEEMRLQFDMQKESVKLQLQGEAVDAEAERDRGEAMWSESTAMVNELGAQARADKDMAEADERRAKAKKILSEIGQPSANTA